MYSWSPLDFSCPFLVVAWNFLGAGAAENGLVAVHATLCDTLRTGRRDFLFASCSIIAGKRKQQYEWMASDIEERRCGAQSVKEPSSQVRADKTLRGKTRLVIRS